MTTTRKTFFDTDTVDPATGQTPQDIERHFRAVEPGAEVAIRDPHGGVLSYRIAKVTDVDPKKGRVYTDLAGAYGGRAWYMKSGKNCHAPKGQTRLFVLTQAIRDFIAAHPRGLAFFYRVYDPEDAGKTEREG